MAQSIVVAGGDLYRVAAEQLGDARQWWRIAQLNQLRDPMLAGVVTLVLPRLDSLLTDGLPPQ